MEGYNNEISGEMRRMKPINTMGTNRHVRYF